MKTPICFTVDGAYAIMMDEKGKKFTKAKVHHFIHEGKQHTNFLPLRGTNKNGHQVWRTYSSCEEALADLD